MTPVIQKGLVSTIIPVFNRPIMIVGAVESVINQTYRPIEIIIVDDGSTDQTPEVLQALAQKYPEVRLVAQHNAGPGVAREAGRQLAEGEFIQYLDSDDLLLPKKFTDQVAGLMSHQDCAVAYGKTQSRHVGDGANEQATKLTGQHQNTMFPEFLRWRWWSTSTPLYRRSVTDRAGAWLALCNEEDWEYDCRIASLGGKLFWVNGFVSITQRHDEHLSDDGDTDPKKLKDRCAARAAMFEYAQLYLANAIVTNSTVTNTSVTDAEASLFSADDWAFFSKSVFLLGRQCAVAGMTEHAQQMFNLSLEAIEKPTAQHRAFGVLVKLFGWSNAAKTLRFFGK